MGKNFGVKTNYFSLLEAFKKEAEKAGWKYNYEFQPFSEGLTEICPDLYFDSCWDNENDYLFSLSNADSKNKIFNLPKDWNDAIQFLKIEKEVINEITVTMEEIAQWKGVDAKKITIKIKP